MIAILMTVILAYIIYVFIYKWLIGICTCNVQMTDKVVLITGGNTGIGFETALDLAKRNAKVLLACRNSDKGIKARDKIIKASGKKNVIYKSLDLASFKSVREFCKDILETESKIDVLINNAGVGNLDEITEDKLPITVQVNHFSPFLLTLLLLDLMKSSTPSRIINVSSIMHWLGTVDLKTFHKPIDTFIGERRLYSNAKLANILFTKKLSEKLKGTGVTVNALHPGAVNTEIFRETSVLFKFLVSLFFRNRWEGAQTAIHLAISPDLANVCGKYFSDCKETYVSSTANNSELADGLWDLSKSIVFPENN